MPGTPPRDPNSFIFMQFLSTNLQNNRLAHPGLELAPPQKNPGYATTEVVNVKGGWESYEFLEKDLLKLLQDVIPSI